VRGEDDERARRCRALQSSDDAPEKNCKVRSLLELGGLV